MDCVSAAAIPTAVDVDDALSSGVVVNGRKLAAQQRLAAAAAAATAAAAVRAPPKAPAAAASASTGTPGEEGAPLGSFPIPPPAVDGIAAVAEGPDRADGGGDADGTGAVSGAAGTPSPEGGGAPAISAAAAAAAVAARARGSQRVSAPRSRLASRLVFNASDPAVKKEILSIIVQYLRDEGFASASASIASHAGVKAAMAAATRADIRRMRGAILDGDWATVESLCGSEVFKTLKPFHYAVGRQQYLELIDGHEYQKAFALLTKRLKPLESYRFRMDEFRDLCYLLTCKSVTDACSFRDWNGVAAYRERLVDQFAHLLTVDPADEEEGAGGPGGGGGVPPHPPRHGAALAAEANGAAVPLAPAAVVAAAPTVPPGRPSRTPASPLERVPPHHLVHLLTQALEHQVSSSRYQPAVPPRIGSILSEYECFVVPNVQRHAMVGHTGNVKCTVFVGDEGLELASGSSDNTVALWETYSGARIGVLTGHTSRVWDVAASRNGGMLASASGDGTVRLWNRGGADGSPGGSVPCGSPREPEGVLGHAENVGDVSSGDTGRGGMFFFKSALLGHRGDVYAVQLHPNGRHIVTAGYDKVSGESGPTSVLGAGQAGLGSVLYLLLMLYRADGEGVHLLGTCFLTDGNPESFAEWPDGRPVCCLPSGRILRR